MNSVNPQDSKSFTRAEVVSKKKEGTKNGRGFKPGQLGEWQDSE